jgi:hypothetical protein
MKPKKNILSGNIEICFENQAKQDLKITVEQM